MQSNSSYTLNTEKIMKTTEESNDHQISMDDERVLASDLVHQKWWAGFAWSLGFVYQKTTIDVKGGSYVEMYSLYIPFGRITYSRWIAC